MSRNGAVGLLVVWVSVTALILNVRPSLLSDQNAFFAEFFDHDFIAFLAVILTISIGLLAQLFVSVGKLGDQLGKKAVTELRDEMRSTVKWLLSLFFLALVVVALKPAATVFSMGDAVANSVLGFLLTYYLLILSDVVLSVFDFDL